MSRDLQTMKWDEFRDLLSGIGPETPLGRVVSIRAEEDEDVLKHFTKEQHRIRNKWRSRRAAEITPDQMEKVLEDIKQAFISLAGGGNH